ncbi:MAG: hypothetical protein DME71_11150 [Verrucomicrobia bacterium]|nr:MAG: hypothetical protein DME71_11150 [Verrucomicrobiota bacterium]
MKIQKYCVRLVEWPGSVWQSLVRTAHCNHDPFLVHSMASFNYGGGSRELLLKISPKHMPAKATTVLINKRFAI